MALPARSLHPTRAVDYFSGRRRRQNATPAILWLVIVLGLIVTLRNGRLPSLSQSITLVIFAGIVVVVGLALPELVVLLLAGLILAGAVGVPAVAPALAAVQARVSALTGQP